MAEINRAALFGKLDSLAYKAVESATVFCRLRSNPYVELVHWIHQILQLQDSDLHRILRAFELNPSRLAKDVTEALDRLPRGATSISDLSSHVEESVERGWVYATLLFGDSCVRTGHLVVGILKTPGLRNVLAQISGEFQKVKVDRLTDEWSSIVAGSPEDGSADRPGQPAGATSVAGTAEGAVAPAVMGKQEALAKFARDLTEQARKGEIDPIVGRDDEIRKIVDILMRRRQNNPILTGEAGVGKTAVVEGFAQHVARGDVPPPLRDVAVHVLDVGLLQAGASVRGEFENRLRQVIEEVQGSPKPIILFIDEAHTLIGAGGAAGTGDAANLLKPALARGTLRTIAATTWSEYKKYVEKDPALTRRFQVVKVEEPDESKALVMMRALASRLEKHHRVQILDEALEAAVRLSHRYIPDRQLPDKAVSLIDTTCARVAISQHAVPPQVEDGRRRVEAFQTELEIISREAAAGVDHKLRESEITDALAAERLRLDELEARWNREKELVDRILDIRAKLRREPGGAVALAESEQQADASAAGRGRLSRGEARKPAEETQQSDDAARAALLQELKALQGRVTEMQGDSPLILSCVDAQAVGSVVADWTGIPVGGMVRNEIETVLKLAEVLRKRVIGQESALESIAKRIRTSRARIENPNRPIAVMLLVGPSGVGKTETALALAEALYGGERNLITINMSEFQEAHTVSTLKGSPPGYVGYGEGGILTEAVRRRPYSIVLLDEVEKAHRDVHEIFFQVFDKGQMEDAEGRLINFRNTIILLTSNVGTDLIMHLCKDPKLMPDVEGICKALRAPLLKVFPPALLGRLVVVPYYPITDENLRRIIRLQLDRLGQRISDNHKIPFSYTGDVVELVASRCTEVESGARMVDAILTRTVLPEISNELLSRLMRGTQAQCVSIDARNGGLAYSFE